MIFDSISNAALYAGLSPRFAAAFAWLQRENLNETPVGRYAIDGDDVYAMVQEPTLNAWDNGRWEAHRRYADIQVVLSGREVIGFVPTSALAVETPYNDEKDVLFCKDAPGYRVTLNPGEMMVLLPQDAHRPCTLAENGPAQNKKIVVKVLL